MQTWTKPEVITVESIDYIKYISAAADSSSSGSGDDGHGELSCARLQMSSLDRELYRTGSVLVPEF